MDKMKQTILEELLKQIHAKMGDDYTEEGTCETCGEPMCGCEDMPEAEEAAEESSEEAAEPGIYSEPEEEELEGPEESESSEDLMEQLKAFFNKSGDTPGPGSPTAAMPLTSGVSVMELKVPKTKGKYKSKKKKK